MKKTLLIILFHLIEVSVYAQSNSFPSSGNVGIGTLNPSSSLEISSNNPNILLNNSVLGFSGIFFEYSNKNFASLRANASSGEQRMEIGPSVGWGGYHTFYTDQVERMRINQNGFVGVGNASPQFPLDIRGIIKWGDSENNYVYSGQDLGGAFIEQTGTNSSKSKIRIQSSKLGNVSDYTQFFLDPDNGFYFLSSGSAKSNVGIGTSNTQGYKLAVAGNIIAEEVKVKLQGTWPDYVFNEDYQLTPLSEIQAYIKKNKHLQEVPSAKEIEENGVNLGEMNILLLKKVEELTLHLIALKDSNDELVKEVTQLKSKIK